MGSVPESSEDESEPLHMGSCWWEWGIAGGIDEVEETLPRELSQPPNFLLRGGALL